MPDELSLEQRDSVITLLKSYADVFSKGDHDLGHTDIIKHHIDTGMNQPVRETLRRHPDAHLPIIDEQVQSMLKNNIIRHSSSNYASNVTLVKRANGKYRFCADYRRLNAQSLKNPVALAAISSNYDMLGGSKYYTTLDQSSCYWQVALDERTAHKTAFLTR